MERTRRTRKDQRAANAEGVVTAGFTSSRTVAQRWPSHRACAQLRKQPWQRQHYTWSRSVHHELKSREDPSRSQWPLTGRFKVPRATYN